MERKLIQGIKQLLGYGPKFINADLGRFTGIIFIKDDISNIRKVWGITPDLDELLATNLEADIIDLEVKFNFNGMAEDDCSAEFEIRFTFD
jgi:hypothetical protein